MDQKPEKVKAPLSQEIHGGLTWARLDGGNSDSVVFECKCGFTTELDKAHKIDAAGHVDPAFKCGSCGFEADLTLAGYSPPKTSAKTVAAKAPAKKAAAKPKAKKKK